MTNYYDNPAMSQSKLKDLKRSPKHFWIPTVDNKSKQINTNIETINKQVIDIIYAVEVEKTPTNIKSEVIDNDNSNVDNSNKEMNHAKAN
ncbi:MAG: hypothetical protein ACK5Z5_04675 [Neisseriaceae bacterium]|jgi:hypothetical protein